MVEQTIMLVPEFENVVRKLEQQVTLRGQSKNTLNNYIRRIALFEIHFGNLPVQIDPVEINEYLVALARDPKSPSRSSFNHMVYGLRYYYTLVQRTLTSGYSMANWSIAEIPIHRENPMAVTA